MSANSRTASAGICPSAPFGNGDVNTKGEEGVEGAKGKRNDIEKNVFVKRLCSDWLVSYEANFS